MFGRALTSVLWGMVADRYGRKPVIIFGTVTVLVYDAHVFPTCVKFRCLLTFLVKKQ